ncbi:hypothetical protein IF1G_04349 [Cordyceps javanica]|uniref:Uncharacterized protein n=1 Tax=Cordyceps javanica TaxID=43265 RepID=A0A545V5X0_9HYPO|nr:hypothetical protein IF1G_04349 [Cordyceps javanica]
MPLYGQTTEYGVAGMQSANLLRSWLGQLDRYFCAARQPDCWRTTSTAYLAGPCLVRGERADSRMKRQYGYSLRAPYCLFPSCDTDRVIRTEHLVAPAKTPARVLEARPARCFPTQNRHRNGSKLAPTHRAVRLSTLQSERKNGLPSLRKLPIARPFVRVVGKRGRAPPYSRTSAGNLMCWWSWSKYLRLPRSYSVYSIISVINIMHVISQKACHYPCQMEEGYSEENPTQHETDQKEKKNHLVGCSGVCVFGWQLERDGKQCWPFNASFMFQVPREDLTLLADRKGHKGIHGLCIHVLAAGNLVALARQPPECEPRGTPRRRRKIETAAKVRLLGPVQPFVHDACRRARMRVVA